MADISSLTINDGATTPVAHVFTRTQRTGNKVSYLTLATAMLAARETVVHEVIQPTERSAGRVSVEIKVPIVEVVNGISAVTRFYRHTASTYYPAGGTQIERNMFQGLIRNFYANSSIELSMKNVEPLG